MGHSPMKKENFQYLLSFLPFRPSFSLTVVLILHRGLPSGNPFAESDTIGYYDPADTAITPEELEVMK